MAIILGLAALWGIFGIGGLFLGIIASLFKSDTFRNSLSRISDEVLGNSSESTNEPNQKSSPNSNHEVPLFDYQVSEMELLTPCIDILCHYALRYESMWTPDKVKFIKGEFIQFAKKQEDIVYLRDRMKLRERPSLSESIGKFLSQNPNNNLKEQLTNNIGSLLVGTCNNWHLIECDLREFSQKVNINQEFYFELIDSYRRVHYEHYAENNNFRQNHDELELEKSAALLGVSIHANEAEIKRAWNLKMKAFHPDRNVKVTPEVREILKEKTQEINAARDFLLKNLSKS